MSVALVESVNMVTNCACIRLGRLLFNTIYFSSTTPSRASGVPTGGDPLRLFATRRGTGRETMGDDDEVRVTVRILSVACTAGDDNHVIDGVLAHPHLKGKSPEIVGKSLGTALREHGTTPEQYEAETQKVPAATQEVDALKSEKEKVTGELDLSKQEVETALKDFELARQTLETARIRNRDNNKKFDTVNGKLAGAQDKLELAKAEAGSSPVVKLLSALEKKGYKVNREQVSSAISEGTHASNGRNSRLAPHTQQVEHARGGEEEDEDDGDNSEEEYEHEDKIDAEGQKEEEAGALDGQEEDRPADSDSGIKMAIDWTKAESPADLPDISTDEDFEGLFNDSPHANPLRQSPSHENLETHPLLTKIGGGKVPLGTLLKTPKQAETPPPPPPSNAEERPEEEDDKAKRNRKAEGKLPVTDEEEQLEAEKTRPKPSSSLTTRGASSSKKRKAPNGKPSQKSLDHVKHARARSKKAKVATPEAPEEEEEHDKLKFLNYLEEELGPDNDIVKNLKTAHERGDAATFMVHQEEWYDLSKLPEIRDKFGDWNKKMPTKGGVGFILQFDQAKRPAYFCNFTRPLNEIYADIKKHKDTYTDHGYDLGNAYEGKHGFNKKFDRKRITSKNKDRTEEPYYCTKGGKTNCFENLRTVCERCTKPILDWERAYQIQEKKRELAKSERDLSLQNVDEDGSDSDESQSGDNSQ